MPIAKCLIAIGRAAESDEYLCRAFEVDPTSLGATLAISNLLTKHGEPKRALSFIERHREAVQERNRELAEAAKAGEEAAVAEAAAKKKAEEEEEGGEGAGADDAMEVDAGGGSTSAAAAKPAAAASAAQQPAPPTDLPSATVPPPPPDVPAAAAAVEEFAAAGTAAQSSARAAAAVAAQPVHGESLDVRLAVMQGLASASAGLHAEVIRALLPVERALSHALTLKLRRPRDERLSEEDDEEDEEARKAAKRRKRDAQAAQAGIVQADSTTMIIIPDAHGNIDDEDEKEDGVDDDGMAVVDADDVAVAADERAAKREERLSTRALTYEELLGLPRRMATAIALSCSLTARGEHSLACAISVRLLEEMRTCSPERAEFYSKIANSDIALLRICCVRAAHACGEWDVAHAQLRILCLAHPGFDLNWALFNAVAGRARSRGYDERWLLRLLMREPSSPLIALGVAHHCFLSRSFKIAYGEYTRLVSRYPDEPLLLLCVAISRMQLIMSRANKDRGHSVLLAFGWLQKYAEVADQQEGLYNTARAYHHLGLAHLAVSAYERVLAIGRARKAEGGGKDAAGDLSREANHNLARICCASGSKDLARLIVRSLPVV